MGIIKRKKNVSKTCHQDVEYKASVSKAGPKDSENNVFSYRKKIFGHVVAGRPVSVSHTKEEDQQKNAEVSEEKSQDVLQDGIKSIQVEQEEKKQEQQENAQVSHKESQDISQEDKGAINSEQKERLFQEGYQSGYNQAKQEFEDQAKRESDIRKNELDTISKEAYQKAIEEARLEAKEKNEETLKQAFEEGVAQGIEDSKVGFRKKVEEIYSAIESFVAEKKTMLDQAREPIIDLALSMAERLVQDSIKKDEKLLLSLAEEGAEKLLESDSVVIRANKESLVFLKKKKAYFEKKLPHIKTILFQEDPTIESEGCVFETDLGFVEATLEAKMAILKDAMHHEDLHE